MNPLKNNSDWKIYINTFYILGCAPGGLQHHLHCRRRPTLTCGGQDGAGEKQRRGEVPVPVGRGVVEDGNPIITGLQGFF